MSADIVNLRRARKARVRTGREAEASANRALHGRSSGERQAQAIEADRSRRLLDGARREPSIGDPSSTDAG